MANAWVTARTDGAAKRCGTEGGWAFILEYNGRRLKRGGRVLSKTETVSSNRMEMTAALEALKALNDGNRVAIYTDSQYLAFSMTKDWKRRANKDLWRAIETECERMAAVEWNWVPREMNMDADRLAYSAMCGRTIEVEE